MKRELSYNELEEDRDNFKVWFYLMVGIVISLTILIILDGFSENKRIELLEEKVKNCGSKSLGFHYICYGQEGYWEFNDYGDYMNAIDFMKDNNCEVLK